MTEEEIRKLESHDSADWSYQLAADEIRRLIGLIKAAEENGFAQWGYSACPWCESERGMWANADPIVHMANCPAFTPEGVVK